MALSRAARDARRAAVLAGLRAAWGPQARHSPRGRVHVLTLQEGRSRPRITGRVIYVSTSGAYALLDDGGGEPLHVPVERVVNVARSDV